MKETDFISVSEFAKMANATTQTVYNWIRRSREEGKDIHFHCKHYSIHTVAGKIALKLRS